MEYLLKVAKDPSLIEESREELSYCDKKKIIQQNNWAICSFNSNAPMNNSNYHENDDHNCQNSRDLELEEGNIMKNNNIPTLDFKFSTNSLNKVGSSGQKSGFVECNNFSTEKFDDKIQPISIVLPICKEIKPKLINKRIKNPYSTIFKIEKN